MITLNNSNFVRSIMALSMLSENEENKLDISRLETNAKTK
jgi:hypothetical protein